MIVIYKGFEIEVVRAKSLAGIAGKEMLFYSAYRISDGWELIFGHEDSDVKVGDMVESIKLIVEDYLLNPQDYEVYDEHDDK